MLYIHELIENIHTLLINCLGRYYTKGNFFKYTFPQCIQAIVCVILILYDCHAVANLRNHIQATFY